jgi:hypothetical protein
LPVDKNKFSKESDETAKPVESAPAEVSEPAVVEPQKPEEPPAKEIPAEKPKNVYVRVLHDNAVSFNGQLVQFKKDQIVTDPILAKFLIENKMPVDAVLEGEDFYFCEKCHHHNRIKK